MVTGSAIQPRSDRGIDSRARTQWLAVAAVTIGLGLAGVVLLQPWTRDFLDARRVLEAGAAWRAGEDPYAIPGYFYTPAMTLVASILPEWSIAVLVLGQIAIVLALAPRHPIAWLALLLYPPVWGDLVLGNETILMVALLLPAIRKDGVTSGVAFGIVMAMVPKPMFLPVMVWMLVHRQRSLLGIVLAGLATSGAAAVLVGGYDQFIAALLRGVDPSFEGNIGITRFLPAAGPIVSVVALGVAALAAVTARGEARGLMTAAIAGVFMGTYVGLYALVLPLGMLALYERVHQARGLALAAIGSGAWLALPLAGSLGLLTVWIPAQVLRGSARRG